MRKDPELAQTVALALKTIVPRGMEYVVAIVGQAGGMHIVTGPNLDADKARAIFAVAALAMEDDSEFEKLSYPEVQ